MPGFDSGAVHGLSKMSGDLLFAIYNQGGRNSAPLVNRSALQAEADRVLVLIACGATVNIRSIPYM